MRPGIKLIVHDIEQLAPPSQLLQTPAGTWQSLLEMSLYLMVQDVALEPRVVSGGTLSAISLVRTCQHNSMNMTGQVEAQASCVTQTTSPPPQRLAPRRPTGPLPAACSRAQLCLLPPQPPTSACRRCQRRHPRGGSRMRQSLCESRGTFGVTAPSCTSISSVES